MFILKHITISFDKNWFLLACLIIAVVIVIIIVIMPMLNSFLNKGFKISKCKTLLKLTIPRIKLLRNRKEVQINQMWKDIANLLETGQEATGRIRVEHIIREANMVAAQEIIELFCELVSVRLPIIDSQRECPLDLKVAISSICFAAPRCADLPELQQVQLAFLSKYGKEFVSSASELMPDCGVNRQLIELLSVCTPSAETKLKLLKEIAKKHGVVWDSTPSETELFKSHEDLLNGPTGHMNGSVKAAEVHSESEQDLDESNISPEAPIGGNKEITNQSEMFMSQTSPLPANPRRNKINEELGVNNISTADNTATESAVLLNGHTLSVNVTEAVLQTENELYFSPETPTGSDEKHSYQSAIDHQESPKSFRNGQTSQSEMLIPPTSPPPAPANPLKNKNNAKVDLTDVLTAAKAAAESADLAAAAAWFAANLVDLKMSELNQSQTEHPSNNTVENPFHDSNPFGIHKS